MAKLTIDGKQVDFPEGTRLFDACSEVRGEPLPHFCYHPDLTIAGVCRLCQVEIEGMPKLTIACNTTVRDGMVVHTRSARVSQAVQKILEMHLINHPVDCPICDQAGECGLQDQYMVYGLYDSKVAKTDKVLKAKAEVIGPHVILDKERCVLCTRCTRFCDEVTGTRELGIFNRGDRAEIGVAPGKELNNNYSLNTVDICPVGALTSRDFRFQQRVWLLRSTPSICPGCATGCTVRLDHAAGRVYRLKPRRNEEVNGPWMCDLGRMEYKKIHAEKRLVNPLIRQDGQLVAVTWQEAWPRLTALLSAGSLKLAVTSPHQTLEELTLLRILVAELAGAADLLGGIAETDIKQGDNLLLSADRSPNRRGLAWLGLPMVTAAELRERIAAASGTILIYGGDPAAADPELARALGTSRRLVYLGTHHNATTEAAALVLPLSMWAEKDGLFANKQGRVQRFQRAVARPGDVREDWRLLADLLSELTTSRAPTSLTAVRQTVAHELNLPAVADLNDLPTAGWVLDLATRTPAGGR